MGVLEKGLRGKTQAVHSSAVCRMLMSHISSLHLHNVGTDMSPDALSHTAYAAIRQPDNQAHTKYISANLHILRDHSAPGVYNAAIQHSYAHTV